ncbi:MAG: ATP-binding protein [Candidatus Solibacter sp.]
MRTFQGVQAEADSPWPPSRLLIDSLTSELVVLDREGTIILVNEAWRRFARENAASDPQNFGVGVNYLEICSSASGITAEGAMEIQIALKQILSGVRETFTFEYPCHSPTAERWFLLHASELGGPGGGAVVLHIDITARKLLEHRLRQNEERFRVALEHSPVVVFNQDRDLRYTWINSPVFAWAEQESIGRTDEDIVGGPDGQELMAIKKAVLDSGAGTRAETVVTFKGERRYYDLTVEPMRNGSGSIEGVTCCTTDITSMKQAAVERERLIGELAQAKRELQSRYLELEALHNEKARWLGIANHDLRNPLAAILANCELLMEDAAMSVEEHKATVGSIYSTSQFMLQLLNDILDISSIESGGQPLLLEPTDVGSLVEESIALSRPLSRRKGTQIEVMFQQPNPVVNLDRGKMLRVFQNLIENAIKYSQSGAKVEVIVVTEGRKLLVTVRDNGPGIPDDELDSIFVLFHRTRASGAARGTGLGLGICKGIVERHGGKIWAENAAGGGAVFRVSLNLDMGPEYKS